VDALAPTLRETVFATVREALTNVGRHAPGAAATVAVAVGDAVEIRVTDDGAAPGSTDTAGTAPGTRGDVGGGQGLVGLRERAALVGGTLDSGPCDGPCDGPWGAGWRVALHVPLAARVDGPDGADGPSGPDGASR
jgi:signal transduction histidine kinase